MGEDGQCPYDGVVEVGFRTNRGDNIEFTLEHMNRGLHKTDHVAQPFLIDGQYIATKRIDIVVDKNTEYVQVRLMDGSGYKRWSATGNQKITCPPMKVLSVWMTHKVFKPGFCPGKFERNITVNTTAPDPFGYKVIGPQENMLYTGEGSDGARGKLEGNRYVFRSKSTATYNDPIDIEAMAIIKNKSANSGWVPLKAACVKEKKVTLAFLDFKSPDCPRGAQAVAKIETDSPGLFAYQLDCASNIKSWSFSGVANAQAHSGTYIAAVGHRLEIKKSQHVNCALKRKSIDGLKIIALKGHKFNCVIPNPDIGEGPGDIVTSKPTSHNQSDTPKQTFGTEDPKCKVHWKTHCKRTPDRKCRKVVSTDCKKVPETVCKVKRKRECKRVPKRTCKKVRGRKVCKTIWENKCKPVMKRVCKRTTKNVCKRKIHNECKTEWKKSCKRVRNVICKR